MISVLHPQRHLFSHERLEFCACGCKFTLLWLIKHPCVQVLAKSLEAQVLQSDNSALAKDCRKEVKAINGRLLKLGRRDYAERRTLRSELKSLLKEERKRQEKAVEEVVHGSQVCISSDQKPAHLQAHNEDMPTYSYQRT